MEPMGKYQTPLFHVLVQLYVGMQYHSWSYEDLNMLKATRPINQSSQP